NLDAPFFIHPTSPPGTEEMNDYRLVALVGFCMDSTLAASRLVFSGVLEQFPRVKFVLSHLGGAVPYLAERIERGWNVFPECQGRIKKSPVEYFKMFYYDTVNFDPNALMCGLGFAGADRLILGSDHPHQIGGIKRCAPSIEALPVEESVKQKILGGNAQAVFKIRIS
ncbi:MAG: amidohydrolase, partial [Chloroflexi bacterium]|nr:amidohydrolase [Chloroflexota bacterium]